METDYLNDYRKEAIDYRERITKRARSKWSFAEVKMVLVVALVLMSGEVYAYSPITMAYTGAVAEKIDSTGVYYGGFDGGYMGGPASNNSLGGAFQFTTAEAFWIDHLKVDARVWDLSFPTARDFTFDWKLYEGTVNQEYGPVPDLQSLLVASPMTVRSNDNPLEYRQLTGVEVPIGRELPAGTYWLARERDFGNSGPIVDNIKTDFYGDKMAMVHNPEPSTFILFGYGLLAGVLWPLFSKKSKV